MLVRTGLGVSCRWAICARIAAGLRHRRRPSPLGQIADVLQARGDLDEALRIRREDQLPVYERLGDVRARAVTLGKIADVLQARGDLDEALRIRREEELPVFERLGGRGLCVSLANLAVLLIERGRHGDAAEARRHLVRAAALASQMRIPFPNFLNDWLATDAGR